MTDTTQPNPAFNELIERIQKANPKDVPKVLKNSKVLLGKIKDPNHIHSIIMKIMFDKMHPQNTPIVLEELKEILEELKETLGEIVYLFYIHKMLIDILPNLNIVKNVPMIFEGFKGLKNLIGKITNPNHVQSIVHTVIEQVDPKEYSSEVLKILDALEGLLGNRIYYIYLRKALLYTQGKSKGCT